LLFLTKIVPCIYKTKYLCYNYKCLLPLQPRIKNEKELVRMKKKYLLLPALFVLLVFICAMVYLNQKPPTQENATTQQAATPIRSGSIPKKMGQAEREARSLGSKSTPKPIHDWMTITVNLGSNRMTLYKNGVKVTCYSVGTGRIVNGVSLTPSGKFVILNKEENPDWISPDGSKQMAGGTLNNPLGRYWLGISAGKNPGVSIGIRGIIYRHEVGKNSSDGGICMYDSDLETLYSKVPLEAPVWIGTAKQLAEWGAIGFE
jgi:lipoprotein-anchoring transpeptidase ErfK/SrfK